MIVILPNIYDGAVSSRHLLPLLPDRIRYNCDFLVANGMVLKNNVGNQTRVFEPIIEETEDEFVIRLKKDKSELE